MIARSAWQSFTVMCGVAEVAKGVVVMRILLFYNNLDALVVFQMFNFEEPDRRVILRRGKNFVPIDLVQLRREVAADLQAGVEPAQRHVDVDPRLIGFEVGYVYSQPALVRVAQWQTGMGAPGGQQLNALGGGDFAFFDQA